LDSLLGSCVNCEEWAFADSLQVEQIPDVFGAVKVWLGGVKLMVQVVEGWVIEVTGDNVASFLVWMRAHWDARAWVVVHHGR